MRGLIVPPKSEDFTADPVELFFDLTFVFAFSQLVSVLIHHPTWSGFGESSLIFTLLWLAWSQYTWSANAISGTGRTARTIFLVGTVLSIPMAAAVGTAFGQGGPTFSVSLGLIYFLGIATIVTAYETGTPEWNSAVKFAIPTLINIVVLIAGGFVDGNLRVAVWLAAVAIFLWSAIRAGDGDWIVRAGHFAERHGLIIIVALGEVIVAIGIGTVNAIEDGHGLSGSSFIALLAAGAFATLLWWSYFDRAEAALEHQAESLEGKQRGRFARDVYTFCHLPIVGGIIVAAAALEEVALHPSEPLHPEFRSMLFGGIVLYFGGIVAAVYRSFGFVAWERLLLVAVVAVAALLAGEVSGLTLVLIVDGLLLAALLFEHFRVEAMTASSSEDAPGAQRHA